jgi:hypothetical protein
MECDGKSNFHFYKHKYFLNGTTFLWLFRFSFEMQLKEGIFVDEPKLALREITF